MRSRTLTRWTWSTLAATSGCLGSLGGDDFGQPQEIPANCSIPESSIFPGGPDRDGIPALSDPEHVKDPPIGGLARVFGVEVNGEARAYPLNVLWWHEIINDHLGGVPILVTYCPLTGSGIVFDRRVDGEERSFGVSGLLFENNLIMFDRQPQADEESLWNQLLLGAQCGPDRGKSLQRLPAVETTLQRWRESHPSTTVVTEETGFERPYGLYPYGNYRDPANQATQHPGSPWSPARLPKELVLGIHEGMFSVAYPYQVLTELGDAVALNDVLGPLATLITFHTSSNTATAFDRSVDGRVLTFAVADSAALTLVDAETGTEWDATGRALAGPLLGSTLRQLDDAYTLFWFAWSVYYPDTRLVE